MGDQVVAGVDALVGACSGVLLTAPRGGRRPLRLQPLVQAAISDDKFVVCNASVIDKATGYIRDRCIARRVR